MMLLWLRSSSSRLVIRPKVPSLIRDTLLWPRLISQRWPFDEEKKWGWISSKRFRPKSSVWSAGKVKAVAAMVCNTLPDKFRVFRDGNPRGGKGV